MEEKYNENKHTKKANNLKFAKKYRIRFFIAAKTATFNISNNMQERITNA